MSDIHTDQASAISQLFEFMAACLNGLESDLALIADAVEADPCSPAREPLEKAVHSLNHNGLHFPNYELLGLLMGVQAKHE